MSTGNGVRIAGAMLVAAAIAGCADSPIAPAGGVLVPDSPSLTTSATLTPAQLAAESDLSIEGEVWVCKVSNSIIVQETFTFTYSYNDLAGQPVNGSTSMKNGECNRIIDIPTTPSVAQQSVSITEGAMPNANWAYTSAAVTRVGYNRPFSVQPSVNDATQTISEVRYLHDVGTVVTFTNTYTPPAGCTYTQGYWKTHSAAGPAPYDAGWKLLGPDEENTLFFNSGKTWIQLWTSPVKGNAYIQLAHQYMAAKLNVLNGSSATPAVNAAIAAAESYFMTGTGNITGLHSTLGAFNEGLIGPGHCE